MAGSSYYTIPAGIGIIRHELAKAEEVLGEFESIQSGFELLPNPELGALPGFTEVFTIQEAVLITHPVTKNYVDTEISAATITTTLDTIFFLGTG
jgi:hypothetical protein